MLLAAKAGDTTAEALLLARLQPVVRRFCARRLGAAASRWADCDDITQEVLAAVHKQLPRFSRSVDLLLPLAYTIAGNKISDHYRRLGREPEVPAVDLPDAPDESGDPAAVVCARETRRELGQLLGSLSPAQGAIVRMRLVEGMSARDTGNALGRSPEAVRVAQHRALALLREQLVVADGVLVLPCLR
ncbi:hypothetical protein BJP25_11870 [Actinokineospora bangkokensis]|uniref:Uncharacterized protein n=1 Tax=Actinokineospora bangkokensis TaxID=1193682 RepID=A0A1Q9LRV7_9PSEU|nr:hypothetical protein BJP25_11870 [Actinokineospora bangkokensis]